MKSKRDLVLSDFKIDTALMLWAFLKKRGWLVLFFLAWLFLAGCVPTDPYTLQTAGNQALAAAHSQMTATAEAAIRANEAAILQQAQTQASIDNAATSTAQVLYSNATATALEHDAQGTQAAATAQAIATQEAQNAKATRQAVELAQLQAGATSTQQATLKLAEAEAAKLAREKVVTVAGWLAVFILFGLALFLAYRLVEWYMHTRGKQMSWVEGAQAFLTDTDAGPVFVQPRKMFSPAMQLNAKTGTATMPQLSPPDAQLYTTMAALAVELQREISKRAQWFTPLGKSGHGEAFSQIPDTPAPQLPMPHLEPLPMLTGRHILIAGPTGAGKTHAARYLLQGRKSAYILDPHNKPGAWPDHCQVIGGGRNFEAIAETIHNMIALMDNRFKQRDMGGGFFEAVHLVTDEIPAIVSHAPGTADELMQIAREGRKVEIYLMLMSQSVMVKTLGIEGQGDARENFATVRINPLLPGQTEDTPRRCLVIIGNLNKPESEESYLVPALSDSVPGRNALVPGLVPMVPARAGTSSGTGSHPFGTTGTDANLPTPGSDDEADLVKALAAQGYGSGRIANLLGGRRQDTLARIRAILGHMAEIPA